MRRYLYDGTVEGLLSAAARIIAEETEPETVFLGERQDTLFEEGILRCLRSGRCRRFFQAAQA